MGMGLLRRNTDKTAGRGVRGAAPSAYAEVLAMSLTRRGMRETERRDVEYALELRIAGSAVVTHICRVPWDKTPRLGQRLPVTVAGDEIIGVRWDGVPSLTASALAAGAAAGQGDAHGVAAALGFTLREG